MFLLSTSISSVNLSRILKDDFRSSSRDQVKPTELIDESTLTQIESKFTNPNNTHASRELCTQIRNAIRSGSLLYEAGSEKTIDQVSAATVLLAISFSLNTNASTVIKEDFTLDLQQAELGVNSLTEDNLNRIIRFNDLFSSGSTTTVARFLERVSEVFEGSAACEYGSKQLNPNQQSGILTLMAEKILAI